MKRRLVRDITHSVVKFLLGALVTTTVTGLGSLGIANAPPQSKSAAAANKPLPSFEVASVRPDHSDESFN